MRSIRKIPFYSAVALLVYMPLHIFLSQSLSAVTGGLDEWKIAKDFFLFLMLIFTTAIVAYETGFKKSKQYNLFLGLSLIYGLLHLLVWRFNPDINQGGAFLATAYNCRLLGYALLGWGAVLLYPNKIDQNFIIKIIVGVSTAVCLLGILQYLLPKDILTHLGYSLERGVKPAFFIDDKPNLPRIMSTLRDPNSLGAYLILPLTILSLGWFKKPKMRLMISGLILLHALALFLSFSRSAWVGAVLSIFIALMWNYQKNVKKFLADYWIIVGTVLVILLIGAFTLRNQYVVQNVIFHSDESTKLTDSNQLHGKFAKQGLEGIVNKPLGHGPGTAGLVSIHSDRVMLTENYFIQIGYEVGVVGLIIFLGACFVVLKQLFRVPGLLPRSLIASFAGLTVCALLLLTWSNEAVAATWWLSAGLLLKKN